MYLNIFSGIDWSTLKDTRLMGIIIKNLLGFRSLEGVEIAVRYKKQLS